MIYSTPWYTLFYTIYHTLQCKSHFNNNKYVLANSYGSAVSFQKTPNNLQIESPKSTASTITKEK